MGRRVCNYGSYYGCRAQSASVSGRAMARRRGKVCRPWGIRSLRCLHARWRGRSTRPIFDCRETAIGLCRLPRTVGERVAERWRDGAGRFADLGVSGH